MILQNVNGHSVNRFLMASLIFMAAYMITIRVNAQETVSQGDAIQLNANNTAVLTGTIIDADENWVDIDSAGREVRVTLDRIEMQGESDTVFTPGMKVTVEGEMEGSDFDTPIFEARSITASEPPSTTVYDDAASRGIVR